jgi:glutathione peroxidase
MATLGVWLVAICTVDIVTDMVNGVVAALAVTILAPTTMKLVTLFITLMTLAVNADSALYDIPLKDIAGKDTSLKAYKGKVVLIVNVASECGYTNQYAGLEAIYQKHKEAGLVVLGFPCNDFGGQEPGTAAEIKAFCSTSYGVSFPMHEKLSIKGTAHPLYAALIAKGGDVGWNFTKFLVSKTGEVIAKFEPDAEPEGDVLSAAIAKALK